MPTVRSLRKLPQTYSLSGRKTRTPITEKYGERRGPSLTSLQELSNPTPTPAPTPTPGVDIEGGTGVTSQGVSSDPVFTGDFGRWVSEDIMRQLAGGGTNKAGMTAASALAAGVPIKEIMHLFPELALRGSMSIPKAASAVAGPTLAGLSSRNKAESIATTPQDLESITKGLYTQSEKTLSGRFSRKARGLHEFGNLGDGSVGDLDESPTTPAPVDTGGKIQNPFAKMNFETPENIKSMQVAQQAAAQLGDIETIRRGGTTPDSDSYVSPGGQPGMTDTYDIDYGPAVTPDQAATSPAPTVPTPSDSGSDSYVSPGGQPGQTDTYDTDYGSDSGGGTVLCSELYRQGIMPEDIYIKDSEFSDNLPREVVDGYRMWAVPLARLMSRSRIATLIMTYPVMKWANHMAGNRNWFGYLAMKIGAPVCKMISRTLNRSEWVLG